MKHLKYLLLISFVCLFSQSCSRQISYEELENQENTVTVKVISNTSGAPITVTGATYGNLIIKNYWERTFKTKGFIVAVGASCSDRTVLITIEIYVNGELKARGEDNSRVSVGVRLKGDGPIYN